MQAWLHYNSSSFPHCKTMKVIWRIILRDEILEDIYCITHCPCSFDFYWQKIIIYVTWTIHWKIVKIYWMNEVWNSLKYSFVIKKKKEKKNQWLLPYNGLWPKAVTRDKTQLFSLTLQLDGVDNTGSISKLEVQLNHTENCLSLKECTPKNDSSVLLTTFWQVQTFWTWDLGYKIHTVSN